MFSIQEFSPEHKQKSSFVAANVSRGNRAMHLVDNRSSSVVQRKKREGQGQPEAKTGEDVIQRLGWESLGPLNPRRYLPVVMGGYTHEQMMENGLATDKNWYSQRSKTAYGYTTGLHGQQGPHTFPHIGKVVAAEQAIETNANFDPVSIRERTGLIPSAGQQRKFVREYEEATGSTIPDERKKAHDRAY